MYGGNFNSLSNFSLWRRRGRAAECMIINKMKISFWLRLAFPSVASSARALISFLSSQTLPLGHKILSMLHNSKAGLALNVYFGGWLHVMGKLQKGTHRNTREANKPAARTPSSFLSFFHIPCSI